MMRRVMAYVGPVLVGPYLIGRAFYRVLVGVVAGTNASEGCKWSAI